MFLNSVPVSSGPWKFSSWQKGVQITVVKNPAYKAGPAMKLDRLVFRYILDTNSRFQALKAGEGQVMEPQPQLQIADFMKDSKFKVDTQGRLHVRAHRLRVRRQGSSGPEAAVRAPGPDPGHEPAAGRRRALR